MELKPRREVPCGICRQCCYHELVYLHPEHGDDPSTYATREVRDPSTGLTKLALAQRPNGACVYLGPGGCTIHDRAPSTCRNFDCKRLYEKLKIVLDPARLTNLLRQSPPLSVGKRRSEGQRP